MSKKIINSLTDTETKIEKKPAAVLPELSKQVIFKPTDNMKRAKAQFWTRFEPGPLRDISNIKMEDVARITDSPSINQWWAKPGFSDWMMNRGEEREKIKYLFNLGLDSAEQILMNPEANANAKVNIIKMLAEMTGHLTKKPVEKFADTEIQQMSKQQLEAYFERKGIKLVEEKIIETHTSTTTSENETK